MINNREKRKDGISREVRKDRTSREKEKRKYDRSSENSREKVEFLAGKEEVQLSE